MNKIWKTFMVIVLIVNILALGAALWVHNWFYIAIDTCMVLTTALLIAMDWFDDHFVVILPGKSAHVTYDEGDPKSKP